MKTIIIILFLISPAIGLAQSGAFWQYKQTGGLETYTKYRLGWPYHASCATYESRNPVKSSTIKKMHDRRKQRYLRNQKIKRIVKRFRYGHKNRG